jgi:para-nitrobenzyl esterase
MFSRRILTGAVAALCLLGAGQVQGQPPATAAGRGGQPPAPAPLTQGGPIITTKLGQLQGGSVEGVNAYRGIPFAAPPVGDLRWRDPRPAASWSGIRAATSYSPACNQAEDCLYLNVWTPPDAKAGAKLPVLVWIHGGAFINGSGAGVDGTSFAKKGVVVVSVNYRLGRMGFFAHPALTAEGGVANYGLADNVAALKWINQNIGAFGGDPGNVTISGESAGAILVNLLMLAPQAQGTFHKAIAQSGFGRRVLNPVRAASGRSGEQIGLAFAQSAGVNGADAAAAKALRALPFTAFANPPGVGQPDQPSPMIDGKWVAGGILDGFKAGREAKVPYLVGGNSNEASLYRSVMKTEDEFAKIMDRKDAFLAAFDPEKSGNAERIVARYVTDQRISEPDRALAREHSKRAPTFVYHFSYVPQAQRATALGAPHGGEISYAFNTLRGTPDEEGKAVAATMNAYWAAFAKAGDPGSAGGPRWLKFDAANEPLIEFPSSGTPIPRTHFNKQRLDWVEAVQPARLAFER